MDTQYDPKHVVTRYDKHDKYTEVYTCPDCGVVGTRYYRSEYNPCPRCGSSNRPEKHVAAWVTTAKVYRVPFKWWLPRTWFNKHKTTGAWIRSGV